MSLCYESIGVFVKALRAEGYSTDAFDIEDAQYGATSGEILQATLFFTRRFIKERGAGASLDLRTSATRLADEIQQVF